jgi:hypothetical protein
LQDAARTNAELASQLGINFDSVSASAENQRSVLENLIQQYVVYKANLLDTTDLLNQIKTANDSYVASLQDVKQQQVWNSLADSIGNAINTSINGVIEGTQTLAEAMKNMAKSIMLAFVTELNQQFIINPILDLLFGARGAGGQRQAGGGLIGAGVGIIGNLLTGLFGGGGGGSIPIGGGGFGSIGGPRFAGGPVVQSYAMGGGIPIMAHAGEYVMSAPAVRRIGMGNLSRMNSGGAGPMQVSLDFQGAQIIPKAPWTTPEDVVKVGVKHLNDDGTWISVIGHRMSRK